jgi:hypothetical protein
MTRISKLALGFCIVGSFALAGCVSTDQQMVDMQAVQAKAHRACGGLKTEYARVSCQIAMMPPSGYNADLIAVGQAKALVLARQVDAGQISLDQARLELAQTATQVVNAIDQRYNNAALASAATRPLSCNTSYNSWYSGSGTVNTTCY